MTRHRAHLHLLPRICEAAGCTWSIHLTKHRIHAGKDGGHYSEGNVVHLCPNHHWLADNGYITAQELKQIVANRGGPPHEHPKPSSA